MRWLKVFLIAVSLIISTSFVFSDTGIYLFGKGRFVNSSGSASDYEAGVNDFPTASSYATLGFGLGLTTSSGQIIFGLEAQYNLSGEAAMTDPSDSDTVEIDTYKYITGLAILGVNIINNSSLRFFINGGAGISYASNVKMKTYTSAYGFEVEIEPPDTKYPFTAFGGVGVVLKLSPHTGILVSGRYQYLGTDQPQTAIVAQGGLVLSF